MMNIKTVATAIGSLACFLAFVIGSQRATAGQSIPPFPLQSPDQLRFQLIDDEQIAGPDGRTVVNGWSVLMFKDRGVQHCYLAFKQGTSITAMQSSDCP